MKLKDLFEKWNLVGLKVKTPVLEMDWAPSDVDKDAAWDLYIELLTRIATQPLPDDVGVEVTALDSVYSLFPTTREILRQRGRDAVKFSRVAIIVLNQIVRPFTAKWHALAQSGALQDASQRQEFRKELRSLQEHLVRYGKLLADIASVEDLTEMEPH